MMIVKIKVVSLSLGKIDMEMDMSTFNLSLGPT